ncbi:alpha/beta fold hydrolase [Trueperella pecoris]|uniref:alpha/beta fold hydrolase n=1 Tax=Trueperella pecoris TaxID=2733571 RepID=UPI00186B892C|nr:alpha/beta fold hydrolase [Trueperella pecoris]QOQ39739.1 alpha/beta fold hydrolase [Trueperella pecoris]
MRTQTFTIPWEHPTMLLEHRLEVPLVHPTLGYRAPAPLGQGATIEIFAREYVRVGNEDKPRMVYFQGGPGFAGTRQETDSGWVARVLEDYRLVMLDERGTGQSAALDATVLSELGTPAEQADYLACFRQDSIVADAEALRRSLQGEQPWAALGQSFGGFCVTTYLSQAPQGLSSAMITAGLPSTWRPADDVYRLTYARTEARNAEFFARYPADEETCWKIVEHLAQADADGHGERLPTGEVLTARRFRMLGIGLGRSYGFEPLHYLLENPFVEGKDGIRLSSRFLNAVGCELSYGPNPLYWALHESIYQQPSLAPNWAAHRIRAEFAQFRQPDPSLGAQAERELRAEGHGFRFTGEHVFPWQGVEDPALAAMVPAVNLLAAREDLPPLHNREVLAANRVPAVAWVYRPDMFVPFDICMETAADIRGMKTLISEDWHHDALRTHGATVVEALFEALA